MVGRRRKIGHGVTFYKPGDRVIGESAVSCGKCENCVKGDKYNCVNTRSVGTINALDGAMSEYFLFPERDLIRIPDNISFDEAALVEPAANAIMAMEDVPVRPGMSVAVMGTGPIGLSAVALAKIYGATKIISVGRSDFKLEKALELGATHTVNTNKTEAHKAISDITEGKGADVIIELSGSEQLFNAALKSTKTHGWIVLLGFFEGSISVDVNSLIFSNINIRTAGGGWGGYFEKVLALMKYEKLELSSLITHRCSLDEAPDFIRNLRKGNANTIKVMICSD